MRVLILLCMLVGAAFSATLSKPNSNEGGAPIQTYLLQGSPQFSYNQPIQYAFSSQSSQNAIPAGAQVVYLQSQPQFAYSQNTYPQGQIAYIQGTPQSSFFTLQNSAVQPNQQAQFVYQQPAQQTYTYQSSSEYNTAPQVAQQVKFTQNVAPAQKQSTQYSSTGSSSQYTAPVQKQSSFQSSSYGSSSKYQTPQPAAVKQTQSSFAQKTSSVAYKQPSDSQSYYNAQSQSKYGSGASTSYSSSSGSAGQAGTKGYVILKQSQDDNFDGSFKYNYETDHGITVDANGYLKNAGTDAEAQVIQGSYTYYSPDGTPIITTYIADENGFVAQGDHLPKVPEIIAKAIEYQRSLPPSVEDQKK